MPRNTYLVKRQLGVSHHLLARLKRANNDIGAQLRELLSRKRRGKIVIYTLTPALAYDFADK
jgi:hypothetical protein